MSFQYCIRIIEFTALDFYLLTSRFLGLQGPDPLFRGTDPDPSIIKQK